MKLRDIIHKFKEIFKQRYMSRKTRPEVNILFTILVLLSVLYFAGITSQAITPMHNQYFVMLQGASNLFLVFLLILVTYQYALSTKEIAETSQQQLQQLRKQPKLAIKLEAPQKFSNYIRAIVHNKGDIRAEYCETKIFRKNLTDPTEIIDPDILQWQRSFNIDDYGRTNSAYINKDDDEIVEILRYWPKGEGRITEDVLVCSRGGNIVIKPNVLYQIDIVVFSSNAEPSNSVSFKISWDATSEGFKLENLIKP